MNKSGTTIVLDDASNLPLQGLTLYGKSTQDGTPTPDSPIPIVSAGNSGTITVTVSDGAEQSQTLPVSTPEQLQAYAALKAYAPSTTITNDADAWMYVQYISNSDLPDGPYSNPKTEIGKYYKALAGYSNEVPPPTCRETQLISNLLDANYQVPFENTTCSIEGYLWDMIRGTDVMANYTPKFESEKFLAMLTGKLVTDYPPKDCERNFWMAKCVEAQARMKVLRRGGKSG